MYSGLYNYIYNRENWMRGVQVTLNSQQRVKTQTWQKQIWKADSNCTFNNLQKVTCAIKDKKA